MKMWKVSTNAKFFDYKKAQQDVMEGKQPLIYQSKGNAPMKRVPQVGDIVHFTCKSKFILVGRVVQAFVEGDAHTTCIYNKVSTEEAIHRRTQQYAVIQLLQNGDNTYMRGVQRTWSSL